MKLNLGYGRDIRKGHINLDKLNLKGVDVVHDLNKFPYPFKDNTFEEILAFNVLEHLNDLIKVMEELHRISKNNAIIKVRVPYFNSITNFGDPTHKIPFTLDTFDYFTRKHKFNFYTKCKIKVLKKRLIPTGLGMLIPFKRFLLNKVGIVLGGFVKGIYFKLKVVKNKDEIDFD